MTEDFQTRTQSLKFESASPSGSWFKAVHSLLRSFRRTVVETASALIERLRTVRRTNQTILWTGFLSRERELSRIWSSTRGDTDFRLRWDESFSVDSSPDLITHGSQDWSNKFVNALLIYRPELVRVLGRVWKTSQIDWSIVLYSLWLTTH